MKILCISDLHSQFPSKEKLPSADMIICAGDSTNLGRPQEVAQFFQWFSNVNYQYKICIAGNHDFLFQEYSLIQAFIPGNVIYLFDNMVEIEGKIIYGTPWQPWFGGWAFNRSEFELIELYNRIPEEVNILVTHCPPRGILDETIMGEKCGSNSLFEKLSTLTKLELHVFGHIHESGGQLYEHNGIKFVNASYYEGVTPVMIIEL